MQTGGKDGGVVTDKGIAWPKETRQVGEEMMRNRMVGAIDHEESGTIAHRGRCLRDKVRWQRIVKKFGSEGNHGRRSAI